MLLALGTNKKAPYKAVATHGYVLLPRVKSKKAEKVSKSKGALFPKKLIDEHGADLVRLWVASGDFRNGVEFSQDKIVQMKTYYRKIRNTYRYLLGNLFNWDGKNHNYEELLSLEKYILFRLQEVNSLVRKAYEEYEYHVVFQLFVNFFSNELSSLYFDVRKDMLYTSAKNEKCRRQAQFVLHEILRTSLPWITPILSLVVLDM